MREPELLSSAAGRYAARQIDEMSRLYFLSRAIHVAAELGIADQLTEDPVDITVISANTDTNQEALKRLLRFLSAYGVFKEQSPDHFCNTALSSVLRDDHPQSTRANLRRIRSFWWSTPPRLSWGRPKLCGRQVRPGRQAEPGRDPAGRPVRCAA